LRLSSARRLRDNGDGVCRPHRSASADPDRVGREDRAFALAPLTSGPLTRDSGTATSGCWTRRFIQRGGQSVEVDNPRRTFEGKRVASAWRARITWVDLGRGYSVGTGTWKIVHGTGAYARVEEHGRIALITDASNHGPVRAEGLVDLRS
jgi:hypothetical protein